MWDYPTKVWVLAHDRGIRSWEPNSIIDDYMHLGRRLPGREQVWPLSASDLGVSPLRVDGRCSLHAGLRPKPAVGETEATDQLNSRSDSVYLGITLAKD